MNNFTSNGTPLQHSDQHDRQNWISPPSAYNYQQQPMTNTSFTQLLNSTLTQPSTHQNTATSYQNPCKCCASMTLGKPCFCHVEKAEMSTQTEGVVFTCPTDSDQSSYFTRGTFQHTMLQKKINFTIEKYSLKSQKDLYFGRAVIELITPFPDLDFSTATEQKMRLRVGKTIRWTKFAQKRKNLNTASIETTEAPVREALVAETIIQTEDSTPASTSTSTPYSTPASTSADSASSSTKPPSDLSESDDEILANLQYTARKVSNIKRKEKTEHFMTLVVLCTLVHQDICSFLYISL